MRVNGISQSKANESHLKHDRRRRGTVVSFCHARDLLVAGGGDAQVCTNWRALALFLCRVPARGEDVLGLRGAGTLIPALVSYGSGSARAAPSLSAPTSV